MTGRVILAAAENGALPGGKVGGIGDVVRDLPLALADRGWRLTVITPSYGALHTLPGARLIGKLEVGFAGNHKPTDIYRVAGPDSRVAHVVLEHELMTAKYPGRIYIDDDPGRPFATDATRFAFFSAAVASYACQPDELPEVLHLHDWHVGLVFALREFATAYEPLSGIKTVFTIHNLALQGIRPLSGDDSSLATWFPDLAYRGKLLADPRYTDCINPMAAAIRLADKLSTVSPTYAEEIRRASDPAAGFSGGEGLEKDLQKAFRQDRLYGILNGCPYPDRRTRRPGWRRLMESIEDALTTWRENETTTSWVLAEATDRLQELPRTRPASVLVSIGRLTMQKVALFMQTTSAGSSALETILNDLGKHGVLIMLGSGDVRLEQQLAMIARQRQNFVFICGYSDLLSDLLYTAGDLFLMPSSFEPCGISQLLALRAGQPCVVHAVGGLKDTVREGETGFLFDGASPTAQADGFVTAVRRAMNIKNSDMKRWTGIRKQAAAARFTWDVAARQYETCLYDHA